MIKYLELKKVEDKILINGYTDQNIIIEATLDPVNHTFSMNDQIQEKKLYIREETDLRDFVLSRAKEIKDVEKYENLEFKERRSVKGPSEIKSFTPVFDQKTDYDEIEIESINRLKTRKGRKTGPGIQVRGVARNSSNGHYQSFIAMCSNPEGSSRVSIVPGEFSEKEKEKIGNELMKAYEEQITQLSDIVISSKISDNLWTVSGKLGEDLEYNFIGMYDREKKVFNPEFSEIDLNVRTLDFLSNEIGQFIDSEQAIQETKRKNNPEKDRDVEIGT